MPVFRMKPVVVEAKQWLPGDREAAGDVLGWLAAADVDAFIVRGRAERSVLGIRTREGVIEFRPGDWVIRGVAGEFSKCRRDLLDVTCQPVEEVA